MTAAQNAFSEGDAEGVAHYVGLFRASMEPAVDTQNDSKSAELERQIQPSTTTSSTPAVTSPTGHVYTDAQVREMFSRVMTLSSNGRGEEAKQLEAEIDLAYQQNRVQG